MSICSCINLYITVPQEAVGHAFEVKEASRCMVMDVQIWEELVPSHGDGVKWISVELLKRI